MSITERMIGPVAIGDGMNPTEGLIMTKYYEEAKHENAFYHPHGIYDASHPEHWVPGNAMSRMSNNYKPNLHDAYCFTCKALTSAIGHGRQNYTSPQGWVHQKGIL